MQYLALIHNNTETPPTSAEWKHFFGIAGKTGLFQGGSAIGSRLTVGRKVVPATSQSVGGFMRFDAEGLSELMDLLDQHPVVRHGGTIELFTMPES